MYLMVIILHKEEYLDDILQLFVELGVEDAVIIESESLTQALAYGVPIFAGLRFQLKGERRYSKIVFAITDEKETASNMVELLKEQEIDFEKPGTGRILLIKLEEVIGKPEEIGI